MLSIAQMGALAPPSEHLCGLIEKTLIKSLRENNALELLQEFLLIQDNRPI
jgi:hypothetical protein